MLVKRGSHTETQVNCQGTEPEFIDSNESLWERLFWGRSPVIKDTVFFGDLSLGKQL